MAPALAQAASPTPSPEPTLAPTPLVVVALIEGSIDIEVEDPTAFVESQAAWKAMTETIADVSGVPASRIELYMTVDEEVTRRMEAALTAAHRRLAGSVSVTYRIVATPEEAAEVVQAFVEAAPSRLGGKLVEELVEAGESPSVAAAVTVSSAAAPTVTEITRTFAAISTTMTEFRATSDAAKGALGTLVATGTTANVEVSELDADSTVMDASVAGVLLLMLLRLLEI